MSTRRNVELLQLTRHYTSDSHHYNDELPREVWRRQSEALVLANNLVINNYSGQNQLMTLQKVLTEIQYTGDLKILVVGRVGSGKSTLINSIVELQKEVMEEGAGGDPVTEQVNVYSYTKDNRTITLIDSPGLQDLKSNAGSDYELLYQLKQNGDEINLIFYCIKMTNDGRIHNDEIETCKKYHHAFGPKFWEHVTIILTNANKEDCSERNNLDDDDPSLEPDYNDKDGWDKLIRMRFINCIQIKAKELKEVLKSYVHVPLEIVEKICVIPAGSYKRSRSCPTPLCLPDRDDWLYDLLKSCCHGTKCPLKLSSLMLRDSIHLAIIIDNDGEVTQSNKQEVLLNPQAKMLSVFFENNGFLVLSFNNINSQSIAKLFDFIKRFVKPADLVAVSVIILCKEKACEELNLECVYSNFSQSFDDVTKIFFVHFTRPSNNPPTHPDILPKKSISLIISSFSKNDPNYQPVVEVFRQNFECSFRRPLKICFQTLHDKLLEQRERQCTYKYTIGQNATLPSLYESFTELKTLDFIRKKYDILKLIWYQIRGGTIDVLLHNKDKIRTQLKYKRIISISTAATGIALGSTLVVGGIIATPFTLGAGIGLAAAGGAIGAAASVGGIGAQITNFVMSHIQLKNAQEHISFDQQFSKNLNEIALKYDQQVNIYMSTSLGAGMTNTILSAGGKIGMAAAVALRAGAHSAGMVLAGVSLVTVPIDLAFIIHHSIGIHRARDDDSGIEESDAFVKWFMQFLDGLLKNTFSINCQTYDATKTQITTVYNNKYGLKLTVPSPVNEKKECTIIVTTLFSGPFQLPDGATLVSAVYDVSVDKKLKQSDAVTVEIEHCVDLNELSSSEDMSFAFGKVDFQTKKFTFSLTNEGEILESTGKIIVTNSCFLCLVLKGSTSLPNNVFKYTALSSLTHEYHNSWIWSIIFVKRLSSHIEYAKKDYCHYRHHEKFKEDHFKIDNCPVGGNNGISLVHLNTTISRNGWIISPNKKLPERIPKEKLNNIEIQPNFWSNLHVTTQIELSPPSIEFSVQALDENANDQLNHEICVNGTSSKIALNVTKDPPHSY